MKRSAVSLLMAALMLPAILLASCGRMEFVISVEPATPVSTPVPTQVPTPIVVQATPEPTPEPTPSPVVAVTAEEAEPLVRRYFAALEAKDEAAFDYIVVGEARDTTRAIVDEVRSQEAANGIQISAATRTLEFVGSEPRGTGIALTTNYAVDLKAQMGFFSVPIEANEGQAVFTVDRVDGEARIVRIEGLVA